MLKQQVWGLTYIDELIQVSVNDDPTDGTEDDCESHCWALHDANYNVLALLDNNTLTVERYEYTPYGQRQVYVSPGINDPGAHAPVAMSQRVEVGGVKQPYGLCEFGHQGLMHDESVGLIQNRYRDLVVRLGRYAQGDPLGYPDGMNRFAYYAGMHGEVDPSGLLNPDKFWNQWTPKQRQEWFDDFNTDYGNSISRSARKNCVPEELLWALVANEQIDYSGAEAFGEGLGLGSSVGPAQMTVETTDREDLWGTETNIEIIEHAIQKGTSVEAIKRSLLNQPDFNIDMAGRLLSRYLDSICNDAENGNISSSFQLNLARGCDVKDFCCKKDRNCDEIVAHRVPQCLIQSLAAMWNNGPGITQVQNIPKDSPNAYHHGRWAGLLGGTFNPPGSSSP